MPTNDSDHPFDDVRIVPEVAERRAEERISPDVDLPCEIEGAKVVHILGVSRGGHGMRVLTDSRLPRNTEIPIRLALGEDGPELQFKGTVAWDEEKDFQIFKRFITGIRFSDITPDDAEALHSYIERYLEERS